MVWLITLPFVLVAKAKYWTILILALVAVALMAIEEVCVLHPSLDGHFRLSGV